MVLMLNDTLVLYGKKPRNNFVFIKLFIFYFIKRKWKMDFIFTGVYFLDNAFNRFSAMKALCFFG